MYTEALEQWFKLSKNFMPAMKGGDWDKVTTEMCHRVVQQNLELIGDNCSRFSDQLARLTSVRKPEDFLNVQKDCLNEDIAATIEYTQKMLRTSMENMEELTNLFSSFRESVMPSTKSSEKSSDRERSSSR